MKTFYNILLAVLFTTIFTFSQEDTNVSQDSASTFIGKNVKINGEIGAYGELYSMKGQNSRRPNSTGRIYFRPTLELFQLIQIPFEFFISTEGSSAKQNLNRFGISPAWNWGKLFLGDFTDDYSTYTLNGTSIRGAGLEIKPGIFRFSTSAGYTQRSVPGGALDGSFKRFLFASKIGIGKEESSYIDFIFLKAKDDVGSLDQSSKSLNLISPNGNDVLQVGSFVSIKWNSFGVNSGIKIELSRDGGNTFEIIGENLPNVSYYNWTVNGAVSFQSLIKISAMDDSTTYDISDAYFTIGTGGQTILSDYTNELINPNSVTPQENLVLGTKGKISFWDNVVSIDFDGAGSVYTRDIRASELNLDSSDFPNFLEKIFNPRVGSNYDYAFSTYVSTNYKIINSKFGYRRIGPGYNSLGTSYMLNDINEYSLINTLRIGTTGLSLGYIHQDDNLENQKLFTTNRNIVNASLYSLLTQFWNANIIFNYLNMGNDTKDDSAKTEFESLTLGTNHSFILDQHLILKNIMINYLFQNSNSKAFLQNENSSIIHNINLGLGFGFSENISANITGGIVNTVIQDTIKNLIQNYSIQLQNSMFTNKLLNSINLMFATDDNGNSIRAAFNTTYQLTFSDRFSLILTYQKFSSDSSNIKSFDELIAGLTFSHRF